MQLSFEQPVRAAAGGGWLAPSIEALEAGLARQERLAGSLYGKLAEAIYGGEDGGSIDDICSALRKSVAHMTEPVA